MSYKIFYEGKEPKCFKRDSRKGIAAVWIAILVAAILLLKSNHDRVSYAFQQFLMPGSSERTGQLLEEAVTQIRQGCDVVDTLQTFCTEVMAEDAD